MPIPEKLWEGKDVLFLQEKRYTDVKNSLLHDNPYFAIHNPKCRKG
jgi:hypothetical protein